jgi:hypothetical protein
MTIALADALESEWNPDLDGFFWRVRNGDYDAAAHERVLRLLSSFPIEETLPRRLVSLLWYAPLVMEWNTERVVERGTDRASYQRAISAVTSAVERVLGIP